MSASALCSGFFGFGGQKVRLAAIGVMGKGFSDWTTMVKSGAVELVALCDCDGAVREMASQQLAKKGLPGDLLRVPFYTDYRKLLDDVDKLKIEAITVSTPDHNHAAPAILAMKQGIHCFVQKPLVHSLWELDYFAKTAKDRNVIVQMGNQGSSSNTFRRHVEILQSGVLGDVVEIHAWTNRPVWPQGYACENVSHLAADPVPQSLDWDAWIGVARMRSYKNDWPQDIERHDPWGLCKHVYHSFGWRGHYDFGTGALGDMACHTLNLPFRAFELGDAISAECTYAAEHNDVGFPAASTVVLRFPERISKIRRGVRLSGVTLYWYDGSQMFHSDKTPEIVNRFGVLPRTGAIFLGSRGMALMQDDYGGKVLLSLNGDRKPVDAFAHEASKSIPRSIPFIEAGANKKLDFCEGHYYEFVEAIRGNGPVYATTCSRCYSDVAASAPLVKAVLMGIVAQRVGGRVEWDPDRMRFDSTEANQHVRPYVRSGYEF